MRRMLRRTLLDTGLWAASLLVLTTSVGHAADPTPGAVTGATCRLSGTAPVPKGTELFDAPVGGNVLATFSGTLVPMVVDRVPFDPKVGRAHITTSLGVPGVPGFRLEGYVAAATIAPYTNRDVPVFGSNLAIANQQAVRLVAATADTLRVERAIQGTRNQVLSVTAPCDAFALSPMPGLMPDVFDGTNTGSADKARGYRMRVTDVALFEAPNGKAVYTLQMMEGATQLFWGSETRAGFLHVRSRSDIVIDGWVRLRGLEAMRPGELMDPYVIPPLVGAQIGLNDPPPVKRATKDIPIQGPYPGTEAPAIGVIEAGTEFYVVANLRGWSSVLPKSLALKPPDGGGFWVETASVE